MPAHRKDLGLLSLVGSTAHNRKRFEDRVPDAPTDEIGVEPPRVRLLTFEEAWAMVLDTAPEGVLRKRDTALVMEAARLFMVLNNLLALSRIEGNPLPRVDSATHKQFVGVLARLGMSPIDARNVAAPPKAKAVDDFD